MTITRKEKILIFVLILFLLVGGTYTLGIMPKSNETKAISEEIKAVNADIEKADTAAKASSSAKFANLKNQIAADKAKLEALTNPTNNIYEESMSTSSEGYSDKYEATNTIKNLLASNGIGLPSDAINVTVSTPTAGSTVYKLTTTYTCDSMNVLFDFIDNMAKVQSYNVSALTYSIGTDLSVTGTMTFAVLLIG